MEILIYLFIIFMLVIGLYNFIKIDKIITKAQKNIEKRIDHFFTKIF